MTLTEAVRELVAAANAGVLNIALHEPKTRLRKAAAEVERLLAEEGIE